MDGREYVIEENNGVGLMEKFGFTVKEGAWVVEATELYSRQTEVYPIDEEDFDVERTATQRINFATGPMPQIIRTAFDRNVAVAFEQLPKFTMADGLPLGFTDVGYTGKYACYYMDFTGTAAGLREYLRQYGREVRPAAPGLREQVMEQVVSKVVSQNCISHMSKLNLSWSN